MEVALGSPRANDAAAEVLADARRRGFWVLARHGELATGWLPSLLAQYDAVDVQARDLAARLEERVLAARAAGKGAKQARAIAEAEAGDGILKGGVELDKPAPSPHASHRCFVELVVEPDWGFGNAGGTFPAPLDLIARSFAVVLEPPRGLRRRVAAGFLDGGGRLSSPKLFQRLSDEQQRTAYAQVLLHALIRTRRDFGRLGFARRVAPGASSWCHWAVFSTRQAVGASCSNLGIAAMAEVAPSEGSKQDAWGRTFDASREGHIVKSKASDSVPQCWSIGVGNRFPRTPDARADLSSFGKVPGYADVDQIELVEEAADAEILNWLAKTALAAVDAPAGDSPDWSKAPDVRGQKSWTGVMDYISSLPSDNDASLVGLGPEIGKAARDAEANASVTRATALVSEPLVEDAENVSIHQVLEAVARCRVDEPPAGNARRLGFGAIRRAERGALAALLDVVEAAPGLRGPGGTAPRKWAEATRRACPFASDAHAPLAAADAVERSRSVSTRAWLAHLEEIHAQLQRWPAEGLPSVVRASSLLRPRAFFSALAAEGDASFLEPLEASVVSDSFFAALEPSEGISRGAVVTGLVASGGGFDADGRLSGGAPASSSASLAAGLPSASLASVAGPSASLASASAAGLGVAAAFDEAPALWVRAAGGGADDDAESFEAPSRAPDDDGDVLSSVLSAPARPVSYDCPVYATAARDLLCATLRVAAADELRGTGVAMVCGRAASSLS